MTRPHARPAPPAGAAAALALALGLSALPAHAADGSRMSAAEAQFRAAHPCPATGLVPGPCKGHVVDRVIPQICGGADAPANMQWLTLAEAKAKARWDRIGCRGGRKLVLPGESTSTTEAFPMSATPEPVKSRPLRPFERLPENVEPATPVSPEDSDAGELPHE